MSTTFLFEHESTTTTTTTTTQERRKIYPAREEDFVWLNPDTVNAWNNKLHLFMSMQPVTRQVTVVESQVFVVTVVWRLSQRRIVTTRELESSARVTVVVRMFVCVCVLLLLFGHLNDLQVRWCNTE